MTGQHLIGLSQYASRDYCTSPLELKVRVRGSFSFPIAPRERPLKLTSMPPAFPVLRTRSFPALIFLCLSAGRTRCITDFPSATMETRESSFAFTKMENDFSGLLVAASDGEGRGG